MARGSVLHRPSLRIAVVAAFGVAAFLLFNACTVEVQAEITTYSGINAIRQQHGLPPLQVDPALVNVARQRSRDMASKNYFSHNPPDGCNFVCMMDNQRVPHAYAGENIAWNTWDWKQTASVAVQMWRNSPPHMENITNCRYQRFGSGVVKAADGKVYYTMLFEGNGSC